MSDRNPQTFWLIIMTAAAVAFQWWRHWRYRQSPGGVYRADS
jgi:hypothetical protein